MAIRTTPADEYGTSSKVYDFILNPFLNHVRNALVEWVRTNRPGKVLDVGCGTAKQLSMLPESLDAVGVDVSGAMLKQAAKQAPGKCQRADATDVPFEDESFDLVLSQFALHEKDTATIGLELQEIRRVLRPDGHFSVVDFDFPNERSFPAGFFKWGVARIEQIAGGEHYQNFKVWMKRGGLRSVLREDGWVLTEEQLFFRGSVRLTFWKRGKSRSQDT